MGGVQLEALAYSVSLISNGRIIAQATSTLEASARPAGLPIKCNSSSRGDAGGEGVLAFCDIIFEGTSGETRNTGGSYLSFPHAPHGPRTEAIFSRTSRLLSHRPLYQCSGDWRKPIKISSVFPRQYGGKSSISSKPCQARPKIKARCIVRWIGEGVTRVDDSGRYCRNISSSLSRPRRHPPRKATYGA